LNSVITGFQSSFSSPLRGCRFTKRGHKNVGQTFRFALFFIVFCKAKALPYLLIPSSLLVGDFHAFSFLPLEGRIKPGLNLVLNIISVLFQGGGACLENWDFDHWNLPVPLDKTILNANTN